MTRPKPKAVIDVRGGAGASVFNKRLSRVNLSLSDYKDIYAAAVRASRWIVAAFSLSVLLFGSVNAPVSNHIFTLAAQQDNEERKDLEKQLSELESQMDEYESVIGSYRKQGGNLKSEIKLLDAKIAKLNLQIKAVRLSLAKLDNEIATTQNRIVQTESEIDSRKSAIARILKDIYENDGRGLMEILLMSDKLSDFFGDINDLLAVQDNLRVALEQVEELRRSLLEQRSDLSLERSDALALKEYNDRQKEAVNATKSEKDNLLKITKGQQAKYEEMLEQTKKVAAEIRSRIFRLLGGGELPFGEAVKLAQVAEKATSVRTAFILSILTQESAVDGVIGRNLGKCYYNDERDNANGTVMSNGQKPAFLTLMKELGLDPEKTPVSCPIASDGAYGGAMGPAQFMPTTWEIHKEAVAKITGGAPPSPFNNLDAFTATALYLKNGLEGCRQTYKTDFSQENCAAAKYYAGKNWRSYMSVGRYGYRVAERAVKIQQDIDLIEAN